MARRVVKPHVARVYGDHPLAGGLRHAWPLAEGGGTTSLDAVTGVAHAHTNAPAWGAGLYGPDLTFTSAGTNRIDVGDIAALDGVVQFTLAMLCRRTATSNAVWLQKGSATNTRVQVGFGNDNQSYFIVANGANSRGHVTNNNTNWHLLTLAYDGTQATDATRLRGFIDGIEQTLTYDAATPTTSPSSAASLNIGYNQSAPLYSNGTIGGVWVWDRALTARDVADHWDDLWGMLHRPEWVREHVFGSAFTGAFLAPTTSAIPSDLTPEDEAEGIDPGSEVAISWTPTDIGNPITSITIKSNGVFQETAEVSIGGGGIRSSCIPPLLASEVNDFESVCTTADANPNTKVWSATPARTRSSNTMTVDLFIPPARSVSALLDYLVPRAASTPAEVGWLIPDSSVRTGASYPVEHAPQARADGLLAGTNVQVDHLATLQAYQTLCTLGALVGEGYRNAVPLGAAINATARDAIHAGVAISATEKTGFLPLGAEVGIATRQTVVWLGALVGAYGSNPVPLGASLDAWAANLLLEYMVRSLHQQQIEEEP